MQHRSTQVLRTVQVLLVLILDIPALLQVVFGKLEEQLSDHGRAFLVSFPHHVSCVRTHLLTNRHVFDADFADVLAV